MTLNGSTHPTILVAEDNDDTRLMLKKALEMNDYRVVEAVNGEDAIKVAVREHPDIVLMDLQMPVLDGLAAARRIREHPELCNVPVVAITAFDVYGLEEGVLEEGCSGYLTKPIDFDRLERVLRDFLNTL